MKKLSTIIFALLTAVLFIVPAQAATICESTSPSPSIIDSLPIISCPAEEASLPIIDSSDEEASLPNLEYCIEQNMSTLSPSLEDFIGSVEVRYSNGQVTIYYGSSVSLVTLDCDGFLIVSRLPSEGIVRMYYNTSDGELHIVDLVVSPGNTVLRELPQTSGNPLSQLPTIGD